MAKVMIFLKSMSGITYIRCQMLCLSRAKNNENVGKKCSISLFFYPNIKNNSKPFIINVFENENIPKSHHVGHYML